MMSNGHTMATEKTYYLRLDIGLWPSLVCEWKERLGEYECRGTTSDEQPELALSYATEISRKPTSVSAPREGKELQGEMETL